MKQVIRALFIALAAALAGYVTWDRVEVYRLNADIQAIAARGEPTDLAAAEPSPTTAPQQEAAQLYAEAASRAREMAQQDGRLTRIDVDAVVGRVDVGEIESTFRKDAPALQLLDRATPLPFAGFGDQGDDAFGPLIGLQALGALAALRADLLAYRGDGDGAAASLAAAVRVQRTVVPVFYRFTLASRQFGSLRILLRHAAPSTASLEMLQRTFAELPDEDGIEHDLMLRRAMLIEQQSEGNHLGGISGIPAFVFHPFIVHMERLEIERFREVMEAARQPWPDKAVTLAALQPSNGPRPGGTYLRRVLAGGRFNIAATSALPTQGGLLLAVRRLAIATLAIEHYRRDSGGRPPDDLAALVPRWLPDIPIDPFSGKPLVYRPARDGYLLYSVDSNRNDDDGKLYGLGSLNPLPSARVRDFGIRVPLIPQRGSQ